jgi:D-threo-aldose 1-dehydrogenase
MLLMAHATAADDATASWPRAGRPHRNSTMGAALLPWVPPHQRRLHILSAQLTAAISPAAAAAAAAADPQSSSSQLRLRERPLRAGELMMGCAFINSKGAPNTTVAAAWAAGIRSFDTAAAYGESEDRLGAALSAAGLGEEATVITKVRGDPASEPRFTRLDLSAHAAQHTLDASRKALSPWTGRVHTIRFHDANDDRITLALQPGGLIEGLRALRARGEIDGISLGMCVRQEDPHSCALVLRLIREAPPHTFDSAMLAYGWNLENQSSLPILLEAQARGIDVHPAGVYYFRGYGHLFDPSLIRGDGALLAKRSKWAALADKHHVSLPAVALSFAALPAVHTRVVVGMATPDEVAQTVASLAERVPCALWHEAQAAGLIHPAVPLPSVG